MKQHGSCSMVVEVQCPNQACGQTSHLCDDGLSRVFRCPACRTKLPRARSAPIRRDVDASEFATPTERTLRSTARNARLLTSAPVTQAGGISEASELGPPFRVGRLQLRDKLGSGAFATIYLAFDPL